MKICRHLKKGSSEAICKEAKILTVKGTLAQVWRIMTGKHKVAISKFWILKSEVKDQGRAQRHGQDT